MHMVCVTRGYNTDHNKEIGQIAWRCLAPRPVVEGVGLCGYQIMQMKKREDQLKVER